MFSTMIQNSAKHLHTGHSKGGAVAAIMTHILSQNPPNNNSKATIQCITFGAPLYACDQTALVLNHVNNHPDMLFAQAQAANDPDSTPEQHK